MRCRTSLLLFINCWEEDNKSQGWSHPSEGYREKSIQELNKKPSEPGVGASRAVTVLISTQSWSTDQVRGLPEWKRRRTGLMLEEPNFSFHGSKFCILFGNEGPGGSRRDTESRGLKSNVRFLWWFGASSKIGAAIYQKMLAHFMFPTADRGSLTTTGTRDASDRSWWPSQLQKRLSNNTLAMSTTHWCSGSW